MSPTTFSEQEGFGSLEARQKRLGQYFSGIPVSKLLIALAARPSIRSVADPMAGNGDMLIASKSILGRVHQLDGIEVDPLAFGECRTRLSQLDSAQSNCILGSAFDWSTVSGLASTGYDLLATNPPYVRYQAQKKGAGNSAKLPSALEVRNGLRACLLNLTTLDERDRSAFLTLAENYSGLSDLAVPSWILCAALVKPGGTLAMVLPDAWLNRDYAAVVQYLLLRWFRIEFIVEDTHAAWFPDAQVKTTLLIARRVPRKTSVHIWADETYVRVSLLSTLANEHSLVGRSTYVKTRQPEIAFAKQARSILQGKSDQLCEGVSWHKVRIADHLPGIHSIAGRENWYRQLEPNAESAESPAAVIPPSLVAVLPKDAKFSTLADIGVCVGQGLRTGANDFFYVDILSKGKKLTNVRLSKLFQRYSIEVPSNCLLPVVRKQADVPQSTYAVEPQLLTAGVLALQRYALSEHAGTVYKTLPTEFASHIRRAEMTFLGEGDTAKLLPALSAVAPNVRRANARTGTPQRYWYMLPNFAPRHRPDLFLARVNSARPKAVLNLRREALIDANFATLWLKKLDEKCSSILLAYLSSTLAWTFFEYVGAVMGGGALKLEATHLTSLPIPRFSSNASNRLAELGDNLYQLPNTSLQTVTTEIDKVVCSEVFGSKNCVSGLNTLKALAQSKMDARHYRG